MSDEKSPKWLKVRDVAAQLDITPMSVYRLIEAGKLPATRATPRSVRVRAADLEAYLAQASLQPKIPLDPWDEYLASLPPQLPDGLHPDATLQEGLTMEDLADPDATFLYVLSFPDGELYGMFPAESDPQGLAAAWAACRKLGGQLELTRVGDQP